MKILFAVAILLSAGLSISAQASSYVCRTSHYGDYTVNIGDRSAYHTDYTKGRPSSTDLKIADIRVLRCPYCYEVLFAADSSGVMLTLVIRGSEGQLLTWAPGWAGNSPLESAHCSRR